MLKIILIVWYRLRSLANIYFGFHDLFSLFDQAWSSKEWLLIGTVLLWIVVLRISCMLYGQFGIRIPFGLPKKHSKVVLRTVYWVTVTATVINLACKLNDGMGAVKLLGLVLVYTFILIMDFKETEDVLEKIQNDQH